VSEAVVRDARNEDAQEFVRAYEAAWDAGLAELAGQRLDELVPFEARVDSFRAGLAQVSDDARVLVAESGGKIVGMATCRREGRTCELVALYVVPSAWGTGVAKDLHDAALAAMRARGAESALLWVVADNRRARRFYEREGWRVDGTTRTSELGPPEVRYTLELV
jgi:GNAT superfamily N-acetyltransferase